MLERFWAPMLGDNLTEARNETSQPADATDSTRLAFMLARHAMTRWRCDVDRLTTLLDRRRVPESASSEMALAARQIAALTGRMRPFAESDDLPVRFEAQEMLAALASLEDAVWRLRGRLDPGARRRTPNEVVAALTTRSTTTQPPPLHFIRM